MSVGAFSLLGQRTHHLAHRSDAVRISKGGLRDRLDRRSLWIWRCMKHEPIVLERNEWRITKAACSCGAELQLAGHVGSVREQTQKLVAAFQKHKIARVTARQKRVQSALPNPTEMKPCEDVNHVDGNSAQDRNLSDPSALLKSISDVGNPPTYVSSADELSKSDFSSAPAKRGS